MSSDSTPTPKPASRWSELYGEDTGAGYAERFAKLAASGKEMHGEATFCTALVDPPARVLDAGCGAGRVAIRLTELGYDCVGVDADASMIAQAKRLAPELPWLVGDVSDLQLDLSAFDLVVAAGNVIPLLGAGLLTVTMRQLAEQVRDGGLLVCGFGLDAAHLPPRCPVTSLTDYENACVAAGLSLVEQWATWDRDPLGTDPSYVVAVHRR